MEEYTREQIQRADDTDLYVFLSGRGESFKRCGKEYRWLRHDSVMINKNEWYRFSQNKGGHAIDFMKEFYGLSFAEAVKELLGEEGVGETNRRTAKEDAGRQKVCPIPLPGLELPERNESCEIARKYLIEQRKLSEQLVDQMIAKGDIYESKNYHNVVFVGRDKEQNPRYAAMRGTDENRYRGEARGSEKAYGFGHIGTDEKLFVFESPIDLLSYITAVPEEWEKHSYISLGGLSEKAMKRMYTEYPHIHSIYLCLDNDEPGNERCRQFVSLIPEELSVYRLEPVKKDWNECLVAEVPVENMAKQMCWRDAREKPVQVMKMSEVEETVVQWLWYPFIPFGKVTLIQGNPGKGKTWLAMAIAAYCTNGKELPGCHMQVTEKDTGKVMDEWVSSRQSHVIEGKYAVGKTYILTETKPRDGYATATSIEFAVADNGDIQKVNMVDDTIKVEFNKIASDTKKQLGGAKYKVYDSKGKKVYEFTTGKKAEFIEGMFKAGETYKFKEVDAPEHYKVAKDKKIKIKDTGKVQKLTVTDERIPVVPDTPQTGINGKTAGMVVSFISLLLALGCFACVRAKDRSKYNFKQEKDDEEDN